MAGRMKRVFHAASVHGIHEAPVEPESEEKDRMRENRCISLKVATLLCSFFVLVCLPALSFSAGALSSPPEGKQENPYAKAEITIQIIPSTNNTFGYDILLYRRPLVHQPNIPGLPGNEGFTTKDRAQTVADFVVKKIRNNQMPPTVTMEDLNNMGVLK